MYYILINQEKMSKYLFNSFLPCLASGALFYYGNRANITPIMSNAF